MRHIHIHPGHKLDDILVMMENAMILKFSTVWNRSSVGIYGIMCNNKTSHACGSTMSASVLLCSCEVSTLTSKIMSNLRGFHSWCTTCMYSCVVVTARLRRRHCAGGKQMSLVVDGLYTVHGAPLLGAADVGHYWWCVPHGVWTKPRQEPPIGENSKEYQTTCTRHSWLP